MTLFGPQMLEFTLASENLPFSVALMVMFGIAMLEGVGMLLGLAISSLLETMLPDVDLDIDGPDIDSSTTLSHFLGWLRIGRVPLLILLIIFLTAFGLSGLFIQQTSIALTGYFLPSIIAVVPAIIISVPCVRLFGGLFERFLPQDETEAVSESSFIGRVAVITIGKAEQGSPAEARLKDQYRQNHYVMIEPDVNGEVLESGTKVLLVSQEGSIFKAIKNTNESLVEMN